MKFKVSKCAVLTNDNVQRLWHQLLLIHGLPIPVVSTYKYLRFALTGSDIDFGVHRDSVIEKSQRLMNFFSLYCDGWTPKV